MSEPTTITLPAAPVATEWSDREGSGIHPVEECPNCHGDVSDGDPMRKVSGEWMHDACAVKAITTADVDAAWLLLSDQLVQRPSAFRASDVKAIVSNVARIARRTAA